MADVKRLDLNDFKNQGYLQEVNRRFFHPLGLALSVNCNDETGDVESLAYIWDYREDPEGIYYDEGQIDSDKILKVAAEEIAKEISRYKALGYVIQPPEHREQS